MLSRKRNGGFVFVDFEQRGKVVSRFEGPHPDKLAVRVEVYSSAAEAEAAIEKDIASLVEHGFSYASGGEAVAAVEDYFREWRRLSCAGDVGRAFVEHFDYLVQGPYARDYLQAIAEQVVGCAIDVRTLQFTLASGDELLCDPPEREYQYPEHPQSFRALMAHHQRLQFPSAEGLVLVFEGPADAVVRIGGKRLDSPAWCLADFSDGWLFHPTKRNADGEPVLLQWSHDSGDVHELVDRRASGWSAGSLFLCLLAFYLGLADPPAVD